MSQATIKDANDLLIKEGAQALRNCVERALPVQTKREQDEESSVTCHPELEAWYNIGRKEYLIKDDRNIWMSLNETQFKRTCKMRGISSRNTEAPYSPFDAFVTRLQHERGVDFAGSYAGHCEGILMEGNSRFMVTRGPKLIERKKGDFPTILKVLTNILGDEHYDQLSYWHGWVKVALDTLYMRKQKAAQAMVLVGPSECGKTLLQDLITEMLGGREAKPYKHMTGVTQFNSDLVGAEHLRIGDENPLTNLPARRNFGAQIKNICVESSHNIEQKHRDALTMKPFWRLSISLNDEPENLMVLPPLDDHTLDKLILLKARKKPMPMPTATYEEKDQFWATLISELPAYMHWLSEWEIPKLLVSQRYGILHFHHPEIVSEVEGFEPHMNLLAIIDRSLFSGPSCEPWKGTAEDLTSVLTGVDAKCAHDARKLLTWTGACGRYLGRLEKARSSRVKNVRTNDSRRWEVLPP